MRQVIRICPLLFFAGVLCAQNARLSGLVKDQSDAVIPNANIQVRNTDTGSSLQTQSNSSGLYSFPELRPGPYQLTVQADGFQTTTRDEMRLEVAQDARVDVVLKVSSTSESVTVAADVIALNTTDTPPSPINRWRALTASLSAPRRRSRRIGSRRRSGSTARCSQPSAANRAVR